VRAKVIREPRARRALLVDPIKFLHFPFSWSCADPRSSDKP
jgi:hypothetical protein